MENIETGSRVVIMGLVGTVSRIRHDSDARAIYTITLDNPAATPTGLYYARREEFKTKANLRAAILAAE